MNLRRHPASKGEGHASAASGDTKTLQKPNCRWHGTPANNNMRRTAAPVNYLIKCGATPSERGSLKELPSCALVCLSEAQLRMTLCRVVWVGKLASFLPGGRSRFFPRRPRSLPVTVKARRVRPWRPSLGAIWTVVLLALLCTPPTWKPFLVSGGDVDPSQTFHQSAAHNSNSSTSGLAAHPSLLPRQREVLKPSGEDAEETHTAIKRMSVSAGAADGARPPAAFGSLPEAQATFVSSFHPYSDASMPGLTESDAATLAATADPIAASAAPAAAAARNGPTATAAHSKTVRAAGAAIPESPAVLLQREAEAAVEHVVTAATVPPPVGKRVLLKVSAEAPEASRLAGVSEAEASSQGAKLDKAYRAETLLEQEAEGRPCSTAMEANFRVPAGRTSQGNDNVRDTRGAEAEATVGRLYGAQVATTLEYESSLARRLMGAEADASYSSDADVTGDVWRQEAKIPILSTKGASPADVPPATSDKAADNLKEARGSERVARPRAETRTAEAGTEEKAPATAGRRPQAAGAAKSHAVEAETEQTGGRTAAWRTEVAAQKKAVEEEARAATEAASEPSLADVEARGRKEAGTRKEAASPRVSGRERDTEEGSGSGGRDDVGDSCATVLQQMARRGLSEAAAEKIERMLAVEHFTEKVAELRKVAARRCLAGEEDACETPENRVWQTAGLSTPPEAPVIKRFVLPAGLCPAVSAGSSNPPDEGDDEDLGDGRGSGHTGGGQAGLVTGTSSDGVKQSADVMTLQGTSGSNAPVAPGASSMDDAGFVEIKGGNHRADGSRTGTLEPRDIRSSLVSAKSSGAKHAGIPNKHFVSNRRIDITGVHVADPRYIETFGRIGAHIAGSQLPRYSRDKAGTSAGGYSNTSRLDSSDSREGSVALSEDSTDGDSEGGSSSPYTSSRSTGTAAISSEGTRETRDKRWVDRGKDFSVWSSAHYADKRADAAADQQEQRLNINPNHAVVLKQRGILNQRWPLQLRMQPEERLQIRPVAFMQSGSRGIFDMLQSLFGNGMDISNPQNFDGGNQGSFFNFMYPADTDYPWACVCDENEWLRWENKEIEAVSCRNQVDTSAQGITAACNPLNHQMNAALPSRVHTSAIVVALLSAATVLISSAA